MIQVLPFCKIKTGFYEKRNQTICSSVFWTIVSIATLHAQDSVAIKKNVGYAQIGGSGIGVSLNYERQLTKLPGLNARIGLGYLPTELLSIPLGLNYLFKVKELQFIEVGTYAVAGKSYNIIMLGIMDGDHSKPFVFGFIPEVGFRKYTKRDWMWKLTATALFTEKTTATGTKNKIYPWPGFSIGKCF